MLGHAEAPEREVQAVEHVVVAAEAASRLGTRLAHLRMRTTCPLLILTCGVFIVEVVVVAVARQAAQQAVRGGRPRSWSRWRAGGT